MTATTNNKERILSIHCPSCGAPAEYDITSNQYLCGYCNSKVTIEQSLAEKRGFRKMRQEQLKKDKNKFRMTAVSCSGCGSRIIFPEEEALSVCSFCGRDLVRGNYLQTAEFPELIIPFRITLEEARQQVLDWCNANKNKKEAKHILQCIDELQGFYLPYELVRGPVEVKASRKDTIYNLHFKGFLEGNFVNTSDQIDNLVLNAMEPFDLSELNEFDFSYLAGQRVKITNLEPKQINYVINEEIKADYAPFFHRIFETKALYVFPDNESTLQMPLLLPAYFIQKGKVALAVNGQTGKVAVRSERVKIAIPWWCRLIFSILLTFAIFLGITWLIIKDFWTALTFTGMFMVVLMLVYYTAYSNEYEGDGTFKLDKDIYTSKKNPLVRSGDSLVEAAEPLVQEVKYPTAYVDIDNVSTPVIARFNYPLRKLKNILFAIGAIVLPLPFALIFSGFNPARIDLHGMGIYGIIAIICVPAYFIKFARIEVYRSPEFYQRQENGKLKRVYIETPEQLAGNRKTLIILVSILVVFAALNGLLCLINYG